MYRDKKVLYLISFIIFAVLLISLFLPIKDSKTVTACLMIVMAAAARFFIKKRSSLSLNKKEVILLSAVLGVLFVIFIHMSGLYFGFYKNPYFITTERFLTTILPLTAIIIASESLRSTLLAQKNKLVSLLAFLSCVLAEVLAFSTVAGITNFYKFMDLVGLTLFPAISANIYYHYVSRRYGAIPNIVFRLIITLYSYFFKTIPSMADSIFSMIKLIFPIVMLALVSAMFEKKKKIALKKGNKISALGTILATVVIVSVVMLISCQFRFGAIVIATESMTGEINKGDMIIYEEYRDQTIQEGQVIVFLDGKSRIIHRVVKIERLGDETRYYTKGDANPTNDIGYRTDEDIVGLTDLKISYVGYPTLWLRQLLSRR